jgi:hypothetical protein
LRGADMPTHRLRGGGRRRCGPFGHRGRPGMATAACNRGALLVSNTAPRAPALGAAEFSLLLGTRRRIAKVVCLGSTPRRPRSSWRAFHAACCSVAVADSTFAGTVVRIVAGLNVTVAVWMGLRSTRAKTDLAVDGWYLMLARPCSLPSCCRRRAFALVRSLPPLAPWPADSRWRDMGMVSRCWTPRGSARRDGCFAP